MKTVATLAAIAAILIMAGVAVRERDADVGQYMILGGIAVALLTIAVGTNKIGGRGD